MSQGTASSITVLYVDDEPDFAELVATHLTRGNGDADIEVVTHTDAAAAVDQLEGEIDGVDCVVSDYEMPGMDGLEFLEVVRERWPDLPFLLFTGRGNEDIASEAISRGVTEYMQKATDPRQFEVLANRIVNAVERNRTERQLERAETRYRRLVEQNLTGIYIIQDGEVVYANPKCAEIFGRSQEQLEGASVYDVVSAEDHDRLRENLRRIEAGESEEADVTLAGVRGDGERFEFEMHSGRVDYEGAPAVLGTLIDVTQKRRRERELEEYETIVETAPDGIFILDEDGYVASCNETSAGLVGYDREELVGEHVWKLVDDGVVGEDVAERYHTVVRQLLAASSWDRKQKFEATLSPRGGGQRTCEVHLALLPADDGRYRGTVGVIRDVTERKAVEEALRSERDRLSALFENIPEPTLVYEFIDGEPVVRRVNDAFEAVFGYEGSDVVGSPLDETIVPSGPAAGEADLAERVNRGEQLDVEVNRETADGEVRNFLFRNAPIPVEEGAQGYAIYTDITERKERERRLEALHEATRELMDATSRAEVCDVGLDAAERVLELDVAGFFGYDAEADAFEPVSATDRARELFAAGSPLGRDAGLAREVYGSGEAEVVDDLESPAAVDGAAPMVRSVMVLPVGDHGVFVAGSAAAGAFDGALRSLAKVLTSNVETALDRAERERLLREREQALLRQNERLEEFAGVVSHDLRSPLTVAKGNVYLARETGGEEYLRKTESALDRMEGLIDDLLDLARQGEAVDERETVALDAVVEEAWSTVETAEAALEVGEGVDRDLEADPGRLRELFENLFSNAVEHGGPGVTVRVGTLPDGFYVEDDGEGFEDGAGEELFEPGVTTDEGGTGFGLSIVQQIAEAHGWEITAAEGSDGGARFELTGVQTPVEA